MAQFVWKNTGILLCARIVTLRKRLQKQKSKEQQVPVGGFTETELSVSYHMEHLTPRLY